MPAVGVQFRGLAEKLWVSMWLLVAIGVCPFRSALVPICFLNLPDGDDEYITVEGFVQWCARYTW